MAKFTPAEPSETSDSVLLGRVFTRWTQSVTHLFHGHIIAKRQRESLLVSRLRCGDFSTSSFIKAKCFYSLKGNESEQFINICVLATLKIVISRGGGDEAEDGRSDSSKGLTTRRRWTQLHPKTGSEPIPIEQPPWLLCSCFLPTMSGEKKKKKKPLA